MIVALCPASTVSCEHAEPRHIVFVLWSVYTSVDTSRCQEVLGCAVQEHPRGIP